MDKKFLVDGLMEIKKLKGKFNQEEFELDNKYYCGDYFIFRIKSENLFMIYYQNELYLKVWCWRDKEKKRHLVIETLTKHLISDDLENFKNEKTQEITKNFIPSNKNLVIYHESSQHIFFIMGKRYKGYQIYSNFQPIIAFLVSCCIILTR